MILFLCRNDFIHLTLDQLLYEEMDSDKKSFHTARKLMFVDFLHNLNKKICNLDLQFSDFEVAKVINDLEAEKVIYLSWSH